jgi:hypothetical protein
VELDFLEFEIVSSLWSWEFLEFEDFQWFYLEFAKESYAEISQIAQIDLYEPTKSNKDIKKYKDHLKQSISSW